MKPSETPRFCMILEKTSETFHFYMIFEKIGHPTGKSCKSKRKKMKNIKLLKTVVRWLLLRSL